MKRITYPTSVQLKELTDDGESFSFSNESGELNSTLEDLIGKHPYSVQLHLRSVGNVYEIAGEIKTTLDVLCSHCGRDLSLKIEDKFAEMIVVMSELPAGGHNGHTGQMLDEGPVCNYTTGYAYDLGDFVHEHIALAEPVQPLCARPDCDEIYAKLMSAFETETRHNPFTALKELELKQEAKKSN